MGGEEVIIKGMCACIDICICVCVCMDVCVM